MKNKTSLILGLLTVIFAPAAMAAYEYSVRITATDVVDRKNNFLIERQGETFLIHHERGCGDVVEGDQLSLIVRGELDGNQDFLKKGTDRTCVVDQAEIITDTMQVSKVSTADTNTKIMDGNQEYRIYYSERCHALKGLNGQDVYIRKYGYELRAGDMIFLPNGEESCSLLTVQPINPLPPDPVPHPGVDIKRPSSPTNVRAIPTKSAVYIYWNPSTDNEGVSHYIVNTSLYHMEDASVREPVGPAVLDNEIPTSDNTPSMRLTGLQSDELYFFRVLAVDTSGNLSSYWSQEATAMTRSSIAEISLKPIPIRIFEPQETDRSFLFRWNNIPGSSTYTVILEVDGERKYINTNWNQNYIRILKKLERKGKDLKLIVRTLNTRGQRLEDTIEFSF